MQKIETQARSAAHIAGLIVTELEQKLPREARPIDRDVPFAQLGLNSIDAVAMVTALTRSLNLSLSPTILFDHPSVDALSRFLSQSALGVTEQKAVQKTVAGPKQPVAVMGLGVRLPGADSPEALWGVLERGENQVRPLPPSRFPELKKPFQAALLENLERFEADLFETKAHEAERMDPQQRIFLETAFQALEDAHLTVESLRGRRVGVFVGVSSTDYSLIRRGVEASVFDSTGNAHSIVANRLSYLWNLQGPSLAVDTACSSSLVALHLAAASLRSGECELAIVGGVNVCLTAELFDVFDRAGMLSPEGQCKTFSEGANGYVRGEGCGVVILKLSEESENHTPYALLESTAVNQDGRTNGLTAPSGLRQQAVIEEALANAGLTAKDVDYVEAHGTGTSLGDPVEYHALLGTYGVGRPATQALRVGSIKTLMGHLEAGAGIAGLIKACLMLERRTWIASRNFTRLNPHIQDPAGSIKVQQKNEPFAPGPARVAVSSFGFGGTNAHVILRSAPPAAARPLRVAPVESAVAGDGDSLLLLSAASAEGLQVLGERWAARARTESVSQLRLMIEQSLVSRGELPFRQSVVWKADESRQLFVAALEKAAAARVLSPTTSRKRKLGFLMTGQGSQSVSMGRGLYRRFTAFREPLNRALEAMGTELGTDFAGIYFGTAASSLGSLQQTLFAQPALFAFEYALLQLLESLGLRPDFFVGHSLGEVVALVGAEAVSFDDGVHLVCERAKAMEKAPAGRMLNVVATLEQVQAVLNELPELSLAAENAVKMTVISGSAEAVARAVSRFDAQGLKSKYLKTERAFHSKLMQACALDFERNIQAIKFSEPRVPILSTLTGKLLTAEQLTPHAWAEHILRPTLFRTAVAEALTQGVELFLEVGPHPTLSTLVKADFTVESMHVSEREEPGKNELSGKPLMLGLGRLFELGVAWDKRALTPLHFKNQPLLPLPATPMRGRSYWFKPSATQTSSPVTPPMPTPQPLRPSPARVAAVTAETLTSVVAPTILQIMSEAIGVPVAELNLGIPLIEYGADSLVLVGCVEKIRDRFGVELGLSDLLGALPDLESVIAYVEQAVGGSAPAGGTATSEAPVTTVVAPASSARPAPAPVAAGVLGNFRSRAVLVDESPDVARLDEYRAKMVEAFVQKTRLSKEGAQQYRIPLADNRVSAGFRPKLKEITYPILAKSAKGSRFTDVDGNEYIDVTMGFGVNLFGHSPEFLEKPLLDQMRQGVLVGPQSPLAGRVAEKFCELTGNDRVAFVNSGTEAIMTAMRLARAATKRSKVVIFAGSYHGHFDGVLARSTTTGESVPVAPGVPASLTADLVVLDYGTDESLRWIQAHGRELAAVFVEPVQSRYPNVQPKVFIQALRRTTAETGCALVFDEVITGFRAGLRGAQGFYGVRADIATYGKILGGGFPIGAVAGNARFLDYIDGGFWQFGDESFPGSEMTFFAGTFCKHPLAMAACLEVLERLKAIGAQEIQGLNQRTEAMVGRLNAFFQKRGAPLEIVRFASLFRFKFNGNLDWLFVQLNLKGVYVWEGRNMFLSTAHTDADIERVVQVIEETVDELIAVGYLAGEAGETRSAVVAASAPVKEFPLSTAQQRFFQVQGASPLGRAASRIGLSIALDGHVNKDAFAHAVATACTRHEILTAALRTDAQGTRNVTGQRKPPTLQNLGLGNAGTVNAWFEASDLSDAVLSLALLEEGPGAGKFRLLLAADHVFVDGLSLAFLMDEIAKLYSAALDGKTVKLAKVYGIETFLSELQAPRNVDKRARAEAYWQTQLPLLAQQPVTRPSSETSPAGGRVGLDMTLEEFTALKTQTFKSSCSLYTFLSLAVQAAVREVVGHEIGSVGVPVAGHLSLTDPMLYNCVGLMPVVLPPAGESLERLKKLKETINAGLKAAAYGADQMLPQLGHYPFDVLVNVEPINELPKMRGLTAALNFAPQSASEFPLMLNAMKVDGTLRLEMDYQTAFVGDALKARTLLRRISEHSRKL